MKLNYHTGDFLSNMQSSSFDGCTAKQDIMFLSFLHRLS